MSFYTVVWLCFNSHQSRQDCQLLYRVHTVLQGWTNYAACMQPTGSVCVTYRCCTFRNSPAFSNED